MAWADELPVDLTLNVDGKEVPARDVPFVKESPDVGHFLKRAWDGHRELGSRLPIKFSDDPTKKITEIGEWKKNHLPKLYETGILAAPPGKPEDYEIKRPADIPDGIGWKDEFSTKFAATLHKHGIPKAAAPELLELHKEALLSVQQELKTDYDTSMIALKKEFGSEFDSRMEDAKRLTKAIFKSDEESKFFADTGIGNHPLLLSVLMRLAPFAKQDSSLVNDLAQRGDGTKISGEDAKNELADIMNNPKNPRYEGYHRGDAAVQKYIDELYAKAYGSGKTEIGSAGGINVGARPA